MRKFTSWARLGVPLLVLCGACSAAEPGTATPTTIFAAGSLARPLREALDSIAATGGPRARVEIMGSRDLLRAVTSLGRVPDLIVTADADEMERVMIPAYVRTSTTFASNRIVLALSPRSPRAAAVTEQNWAEMVAGGGLQIARADPFRAPLGFRTQLVWKLAESELARPGLAAKLAAASPARLMRANESDLAALLESGDADGAWCYESLARALRLKYVRLGDKVDLGTEADSLAYARASVRVAGDRPGDSITVVGAPIRYGVAVLDDAPDVGNAIMIRNRLLDATSARIMRRNGLDVLAEPRIATITTKFGAAQ